MLLNGKNVDNQREATYIKYHGTNLCDKKRMFLPFSITLMLNIEQIEPFES